MKLQAAELSDSLSIEETLEDTIVETLRFEISAAKVLRKTILKSRVSVRLQLDSEEHGLIDAIIGKLIATKELIEIGQGLLAVTPVRLVSLCDDHYLILSSLPTSYLEPVLGCDIQGGLKRFLINKDSFDETLHKIGGKRLTIEKYLGLSKETIANQAWLDSLSLRQGDMMNEKTVIQNPESFQWYQSKWLSESASNEQHQLWRGENSLGFTQYFWSTKKDLVAGHGLLISANEAIRTQYALDRAPGKVNELTYREIDNSYQIDLNLYLPVNEYKALHCFCYSSINQNEKHCFQFHQDCFEALCNLLNEQLGITFKKEGV